MSINSPAHNVAISHVDFVRLGPDGQLWVQTVTPTDGGRGVSWKDGEWHTAADPAAARDVLEGAGVLSTGLSPKTGKADADTKTADADAEDRPAALLTGWWWLLPGAAAGIALGLGARPLAAELARRREPRPHHELIG